MAKPRQRVRLEDGLKFDLNKLLREGLGPPGRIPWPAEIRWTSTRSAEIAKGWITRAISAREKVKSRLIGNLDPREWELPPKPKWMRWDTYERLAENYRFQQRIINQCFADFVG
jgi:hypothetical protein